ncbi:MAG TPA: MarR family winged helix-turn-helix transcriptional regulator [Propionicimonas sp.]|jgi:DNA-binding MarR family transcriptional regulator|uniref:MarR family winged helix-turn-helix transcriptional regulator n=1 Tax=Propionicimonas sp. TaxID=1955623 RepID=UPI002F40DF04
MQPSIQDLGLAVKRLQWRHHRESNKRLAAVGLSLVQWDVLRHLHRTPELSLHAVAALTFQTDQSMGELARRMIDRGLIERIDGTGRSVWHRLTPAGERAYADGAGVFEGVLSESVGQLTPAEQKILHELLVKAASAQ